MRPIIRLLLAVLAASGSTISAQDKSAAIPPRFQSLAKDGRFRLTRILGTPEMAPTFGHTSSFSADGKLAVYAEDLTTGDEKTPRLRSRLLIWDLQSKAWPREIDFTGKNVTALTLSADGSKVLLAGQVVVVKARADKDKDQENDYRAYLSLLDLNTGKEIYGFLTKDTLIYSVALAADGNTALTGWEGVKRWDLKQGKELAPFKDVVGSMMAFAWLPGGAQFLAGDNFGKVVLRDLGKDNPVRTYESKQRKVAFTWWLGVSRDGKRFVSGNEYSQVSLWETSTGKEISLLPSDPVHDFVNAIALADDGKTVLCVRGKANPAPDDFAGARLMAWDGEANKVLWSHTVSYRGRVSLLVQGDKLLVGGGPNLFETWNIKDGKLLESWGGHKGSLNALAVTTRGDILSTGQEGVLMTWRNGQLVDKSPSLGGPILALAISKNREHGLTGGADLAIRHWSAKFERPAVWKRSHTGAITSLAFSDDGSWACSGSADRTIKIWNLATGKDVATITGHSETVNAVAISPDERWIASASDDKTVRLSPIKDGKPDRDRDPVVLEKHTKAVLCVAFSPDGKTLLSGSQDQKIIAWKWQKGEFDFFIPGHKNWVTSIVFVDEKTVLSCSDDLSICEWDMATGNETARIDFGSVGDSPRCMTLAGPDRLLVGTSSWLIYDFQRRK